ncbi:hypothetical protein, partial [Pseudoalteromonas luteoviolacea]
EPAPVAESEPVACSRTRYNCTSASPMTKARSTDTLVNVAAPKAMPNELRAVIKPSGLGAGSKSPTARASAQMASPQAVE